MKLTQVQYICPIFRFEKQTFSRGRFVFQTEISGKYIVLVLSSRLFYFLSSRRRGDQSTVFCIVNGIYLLRILKVTISAEFGLWDKKSDRYNKVNVNVNVYIIGHSPSRLFRTNVNK